jgi:formate-dependent nitrite reductase membrane component NrfD
MEPIILMQSKWGATFNIPWYLFLGGMSGGVLIVAALAELLGGHKPKFHALSGLSALLVLPFMIIGGLALTFHLGKPERGLLFPFYMTNYSSWLTIGGWIIGAFVPVSLAVAAAWYFNIARRLRVILAIVALPMGVLMCLYTGYLLSATQFVPLWAENYLPILFLLSGLSTGLAVCAINAYVVKYLLFPKSARERILNVGLEETATVLGKWDIGVVILEMIWLYAFVNFLNVSSTGNQVAAQLLTSGVLAPWFWAGVVVIGLVLPLVLGVLEPVLKMIFKTEEGWKVGWPLFAKLHLVLIGGLLLRYVIVWGGDLSQPLNFPPPQGTPHRVAQQGSPEALSQALRQIIQRR